MGASSATLKVSMQKYTRLKRNVGIGHIIRIMISEALESMCVLKIPPDPKHALKNTTHE
jgi:hypothetical protein